MVLTAYFALSPVIGYRMHTSDSIYSISATKNVSHQSHLLRLRQYLMAQSGYPANPLKKIRFSKCVNLIAGDRAFLSPSLADLSSANLTPASRRQDHTTLPSAGQAHLVKSAAASTAPLPYVRDDRETPLCIGPGWREM